MKNVPSLFLISAALLALAACGQTPASTGAATAPPTRAQTGSEAPRMGVAPISLTQTTPTDTAQGLGALSTTPTASATPNCIVADGASYPVFFAVSGLTGDTSAELTLYNGNGPLFSYPLTLSGGAGSQGFAIDAYQSQEAFALITGSQTGTVVRAQLVATTGDLPCTGLPPAVTALTLGGSVPRGSSSIPLSAVISDAERGFSVITAAEYRLDGGAWIPLAVTPPDTSFGRRIVQPVSATLPVPDALGNHTVCVRGTDIYNLTSDGAACQTFSVVDATPPTVAVTTPLSGAQYAQGQGVTASYACADEAGGSGLASCVGSVPSGSALDTSTAGARTFSVTASDQAGNTTTKTVSYTVAYPFRGFLQPVDTLPTVNTVKAGSSVPVKFSLGGDRGLNILAAGSPTVKVVPCDSSVPADEIEQTTAASNSSLSYDASTDTYSYIWKTDRSWAGTCRQLNVVLSDGTSHLAAFKFR